MAKRGTLSPAIAVNLDYASAVPLYRQLYEGLRQAILGGRLQAGRPLPSTRLLASALDVSRTTVVLAFEQLLAEGYVQGKVGAGTYVADVLPDDHLYSVRNASMPDVEQQAPRMLGKRGQAFADYPMHIAQVPISRAFRPGIPALDVVPFAEWQRVRASAFHNLQDSDFDYGHPMGYEPLRHAIAEYLTAARAVRCTAAHVLVVSGTHQALYLIAQLLLNPGDAVWIEDPVYPGARFGFENAQAELIPVSIDDEG